MKLSWPWFVLLIATILVQFSETNGCFPEEKRALLDFKVTLSNQSLLPSWVDYPKSNCCVWERVTCDSSSHHVIHLSLENLNGYGGKGICRGDAHLNWALFLSFKELRSLNLTNNCFDGFVSKGDYRSKSALKKLETLDLSYNFLNETMLEILNALPSLKNLILAYNYIGGRFPMKELLCLPNLETLDLSMNELISPSTTQDYRNKSALKKLETLDLHHNFLNETTMEFLSALSSLKNLILSNNDIGGPFPIKVLANLSKLEVLKLSDSFINGSFPYQVLCKMKQLQELDVSFNDFHGTLDTCLGNLTSLRTLDLSYNSLMGSIPEPLIGCLASLEYLSLSSNEFEGSFSLNILANHSKLKVLDLKDMPSKTFEVETENSHWNASFQLEWLTISYCNLPTKRIPTFLSYQNGLRYIDLSGNNLVGRFPSWLLMNNPILEVVILDNNSFTGPFELPSNPIHHMDQVYNLDISNNQIQGELPNDIGFFLPHLEYLVVSNNMFDGLIPNSIGEMSSLRLLHLSHNNFSGKVPENILNGCISLERLMMDNNQLNGTLPSGIGKLGLNTLTASRNNFEGAIPKELCQLKLLILVLSHNKLSGALPSCFKMPFIYISLRGNSLTGTITEASINNSDTFGIDLSDNKITGTIPERIYGLQDLRFLLLAGNQLQGKLSNQICQLQDIHILDLSRNNFTGSIPSCLNKLSFGDEVEIDAFDIGEVQFITKSVSLSYKGDTLEQMSGLDLSSNQLTGEIPHQIGDLHALHALNLSHNHLNGSIPESFKKLKNIESLDLSNNYLSGQIPLHLQDLHYLSFFNVCYNNLSGIAPDKGQFGTFDERSYKGNPYLSWSNSNRGITRSPPSPTPLNNEEKNDSAIDFTSFYWSFAGSYVMVILVLVTILWINPYWRRAWFYFVGRCLDKCFGQFLEDVFN